MHNFRIFLESIGVAIATLMGWVAGALPPAAALCSILWMFFQFWHSKPMKEWRAGRARQ